MDSVLNQDREHGFYKSMLKAARGIIYDQFNIQGSQTQTITLTFDPMKRKKSLNVNTQMKAKEREFSVVLLVNIILQT